jgi:hypothetical protein
MKHTPSVESVEAAPFELAGNKLVAFVCSDQVHTIDRALFELLFRPVAPVPAAELPVVEAGSNPLARKRRAEAAPASPPPAAPRKPAKAPKAEKPDSFDQYPVSLRDPRASSQRFVHDALLIGPGPLGELVKRCKGIGWNEADSGLVMGALGALRTKGLARKHDDFNGDWTLV